MIIRLKVFEQTLSVVDTKSVPRKGSKDYLVLHFLFSSDWKNLDKICYLQHGEVSQPIDVVDNLVEVPEWFTQQDSFDVTLFGTSGSQEVPTNVVSLRLEKSNTLWEQDAPEPQPGWLAKVIELNNHPAIPGENGYWLIWDTDKVAYVESELPLPPVSVGPKGDKGDTGEQGPKGDKGDTGAQGPAGAGMDITGASVGQIVKITAVDDSGKPTAWEATDYFTEADKQEIAKAAAEMVSIPTALPNPNSLTFTGAVTGSYDGSEAKTINIPSGGGGVGSISLPLLYDLTTTEEVSWIDTGDNAYTVNSFLVVELVSIATTTNEKDGYGSASMYPLKSNALQSPWNNFVIENKLSDLLPRTYNKVFRAFCFRGEDGHWSSITAIRNDVNAAYSTPRIITVRDDGVSNQPMRGLIIGNAFASNSNVLGVGSRLRVWGI